MDIKYNTKALFQHIRLWTESSSDTQQHFLRNVNTKKANETEYLYEYMWCGFETESQALQKIFNTQRFAQLIDVEVFAKEMSRQHFYSIERIISRIIIVWIVILRTIIVWAVIR